jgi:hypothetical protein
MEIDSTIVNRKSTIPYSLVSPSPGPVLAPAGSGSSDIVADAVG